MKHFMLVFWGIITASSLIPSVLYAETSAELRLYCTQYGGFVEDLSVQFNTRKGEITGVTRKFCLFYVDQGILTIGLETFAASTPSIAANYIKTLPEIGDESPLLKGPYSNPSHNVCKNLGGAMVGFVLPGDFTHSQGQSDICVFGDSSMVSSWSLIYMANHREGYDEIKNQVKAEPLT